MTLYIGDFLNLKSPVPQSQTRRKDQTQQTIQKTQNHRSRPSLTLCPHPLSLIKLQLRHRATYNHLCQIGSTLTFSSSTSKRQHYPTLFPFEHLPALYSFPTRRRHDRHSLKTHFTSKMSSSRSSYSYSSSGSSERQITSRRDSTFRTEPRSSTSRPKPLIHHYNTPASDPKRTKDMDSRRWT